MPHISTLIADINYLLTRKDGWFTEELSNSFAQEVTLRLSDKFNAGERKPTLRLSKMGPRCPCALWHSIHRPDLEEPLPPGAEFKYSYGHIIEALAIALAKAAGHEVLGEQSAVEVDGISGHRDCIIDGCVVDVKSTTSHYLQAFKTGEIRFQDSFGYLDQLDGYLVGSSYDPLVTNKDRGYLLAIDKTLGHMVLYEHEKREESIRNRIATYKTIVSKSEAPQCQCGTRPHGKSGNIELDVRASYDSFKYACFPHLRKFLYSNGPVYLTKVTRKPDVPEVDRHGRIVYLP